MLFYLHAYSFCKLQRCSKVNGRLITVLGVGYFKKKSVIFVFLFPLR